MFNLFCHLSIYVDIIVLQNFCICNSIQFHNIFICVCVCFCIICAFSAVGMERNIRLGTNEDNSQCTPSLIPIHEVFSAARDDNVKSRVADQIILRARLSRTDGITGHIGKEYVPMYVRNTLFENNGTSDGGDQTYENMGKDSRYSGQLGRTMQALEPSKHEQKHLANKLKQSSRKRVTQGEAGESKSKSFPSVAAQPRKQKTIGGGVGSAAPVDGSGKPRAKVKW
jgi:hypothetical protein